MISKYQQTAAWVALVAILCGAGVGFKLWIEDHDQHIRAEYQLRDLQQAAAKLKQHNDELTELMKSVEKAREAKDQEIRDERAKAQTAIQQAQYIARNTGIPVTAVEVDGRIPENPQKFEIDASDLGKAADQVEACKQARNDLDACKRTNGVLVQTVENKTSEVVNRDGQIKVLQSEKNGTKRGKLTWFSRGTVVGAIAAFVIEKFVLKK